MTATVLYCLLGTVNLIMNKKLLKRIDEIFEQKLQEKTGWGRNDVLKIYREAVNEAILEMLDA